MSSLFYGLEIAKTGLSVSQLGINLTGHNIANVNTKGYTRQRIIQQSIDPSTTLTRLSKVSKTSIGGGVTVSLIDQVRSDYLDRQFRSENSTLGNYNTRAEELSYVETVLDELSDSSISAAMADFFNSLSELAGDAVNDEIRTNVQQNALKMIETFHHYHTELTDLQNTYDQSINVTVTEINDLLKSIASYNKQVYSYELSGEQANDLRDKRNLLLDELSGLINISYGEDTSGRMIVSCEGVELVNHTDYTLLETAQDPTTGFYNIYYEGTATDFAYSDGKLMAFKNLRDGNTKDNIGIPYIIERLNTLAKSLAQAFNDIHTQGYTKPQGATASRNGVYFFDVPAGGYDDITAGNLALSADVMASVYNIAASSELVTTNEVGNNEIALALAALSTREDIPVVGNFEDYLNSAVVEVAVESSTAQTLAASQQAIVDNLDERKTSISGVSLDEEMIQMMTYQHAYAASSRVLTAMDEALNILINRTGSVGL